MVHRRLNPVVIVVRWSTNLDVIFIMLGILYSSSELSLRARLIEETAAGYIVVSCHLKALQKVSLYSLRS